MLAETSDFGDKYDAVGSFAASLSQAFDQGMTLAPVKPRQAGPA